MNCKLSVVVVGRNEAKTLGDVFARFGQLHARLGEGTQLVYVDSDSEDSSVAIAQAFREEHPDYAMQIVRLKGRLNSAIARNVGIRFLDPKTEFVFFLDGDIVFDVDFVVEAIAVLRQEPTTGSVCGVVMNSFDGTDAKLFARRNARIGQSDLLRWHGGNFVTRKAVLDQVGLFDEGLMRHQDIDYAFRIRNGGYALRLLARRLGIHYTTSYMDPDRLWRDLKRGNFLYSGLLFRKYLVSRRCLDMLRVRTIPGVVFRCCVLCCAILSVAFFPFAIPALFGVLAVLARNSAARHESFSARILSFAWGVQFLWGLFAIRRRQVFDVQVM